MAGPPSLSGQRSETQSGQRRWQQVCFETKAIESVKPGLELVTKLANEKITKNKATVEARKTFGVGKGLRIPYI